MVIDARLPVPLLFVQLYEYVCEPAVKGPVLNEPAPDGLLAPGKLPEQEVMGPSVFQTRFGLLPSGIGLVLGTRYIDARGTLTQVPKGSLTSGAGHGTVTIGLVPVTEILSGYTLYTNVVSSI